MSYLSTNQIATKFAENHSIPAGESRNIKLTHKQSSWLLRQAHYDNQIKNSEVVGSILDSNENVIGSFSCTKKHMRNSVYVLVVNMYRNEKQITDQNKTILSQIEQYEQIKKTMTEPIMIENCKMAINYLKQQLVNIS